MLDKKKGATKTKTLGTHQRTLLELFPPRKIEKPLADPPADPPEEPTFDESSPVDLTCVEPIITLSDAEQEASQPGDEPPNSPMIISEPTSTPSSQHIIVEDEEAEQQVGTSVVDDDREAILLLPGGSQDEPIIIDSSPPRTKVERDPPKKLWSIFAPRPIQSNKPAVQRSSKPTPAASFPSAEMQHVRGPQATYISSSKFPCHLPRVKSKTVHDAQPGIQQFLREEDNPTPAFLEFDLRPCKSEAEKVAYLDMIPEEHKRSHPAINKLTSGHIEGQVSPCQLWTDKWRPKHAAEVLGNEKSASYLRDWLRALALEIGDLASPDASGKGKARAKNASKGVKRPRVVRAVDKRERKKRRIDSDDEDDSWIVYDDESEEEIPTEDGEEEQDVKFPSNEANTFEMLTNTIILAGPTGSGKTACVYACAEELDWDVFEVYPGIGKRNGASIDNLIGDVGKNHLVRKATTRPGNVNEISDGALLQGFGFLESAKSNNADSSGSIPRQSLVLLEEVDVLFKEDSNFWPAVINFLRDCRRPVICTCNDISLVPISDLPVQNVLAFEPCPPSIAASYLQAVCCSEGWLVDREALIRLYQMPYETTADAPQAAPDLRRTMHRLQLWSYGSHEASREKSHGEEGRQEPVWKSLPKQSEMLSFLDSEKRVCGTPCETTEPCADDEVGYTILFEEFSDGHAPIISYAMRGARGGVDGSVARQLSARREYERRVAAAVGRMVPVGALGRERMYTEYAAYVRQMVAGEDGQEARMAAAGIGGRGTRNSRRYERAVCLGDSERRQLWWEVAI